jgi:hypothetical protein
LRKLASPKSALAVAPTKSIAAAMPPYCLSRVRRACGSFGSIASAAPARSAAARLAGSMSATMGASPSARATASAAEPTPPAPMMSSGRPAAAGPALRSAL